MFQQYKAKYVYAKNFCGGTGAGLTDQDRKDGIGSVDEKLETLCPCYAEMDAIFRTKPNVVAFGIYDSCAPPPEEEEHVSEGTWELARSILFSFCDWETDAMDSFALYSGVC